MKSQTLSKGFLSLLFAALLLAGCANQMEPAKKAVAEIEAAVTAAGADASKYVPDQVQAVTTQLDDLKMKFDQKDYKGVIAAAPALLAQAKGLAAAAADQKAKVMAALNSDWTNIAGSVPAALAAIQSRVDILSKAKKLPAGMDKATLDTAKTGIADATSMWSQATAAQSSGNLEQAVSLAKQVKEKADGLLATLGMKTG